MMLLTIVTALHKIKFYQSNVVKRTFIPLHAFQKLVKQISNQYDVQGKDGLLANMRWEKAAIFVLQSVTKDI